MEIEIHNFESESLSERLGISDERVDELRPYLIAAKRRFIEEKVTSKADLFSDIALYCENVNELIMLVFEIGRFHGMEEILGNITNR